MLLSVVLSIKCKKNPILSFLILIIHLSHTGYVGVLQGQLHNSLIICESNSESFLVDIKSIHGWMDILPF